MGAAAHSAEEVGKMVASLGDAYLPYEKVIIENDVNGELISSSSEAELMEMFEALFIERI